VTGGRVGTVVFAVMKLRCLVGMPGEGLPVIPPVGDTHQCVLSIQMCF
jgi:hypothetical protein